MKLVSPSTVLADLTRRLDQRFGLWLLQDAVLPQAPVHPSEDPEFEATGLKNSSSDSWPLRVALGSLTERDVLQEIDAVDRWARAWHQARTTLPSGVTLISETRRWTRVGEQSLPVRLVFEGPTALAAWVSESRRWTRACGRRDVLTQRFPNLRGSTVCRSHVAVFADWPDRDVSRLQALLAWFETFPRSDLYLRQLPVPDMDTKWVEPRKAVVRDFVLAIQGKSIVGEAQDFHMVCGLRKPSSKLRMRILCPHLRAMVAGLSDIESPVQEIASMALPVRAVIIVENLETGLALPDYEGTVAFMRLGHAVSELARIPWLVPDVRVDASSEYPAPRLVYWGDIDTHGFAILSRARGIFSRLQSILMDEATFHASPTLWVTEAKPHRAEELRHLTPAETQTYTGLRTNRWGESLRLEQERLPWQACLRALEEALMPPV